MIDQRYLFNPVLLQSRIKKLRMKRKAGKMPSKRIEHLTTKDRTLILQKTDHKCHICGQALSINNFLADHVVAHIRGGDHKIDNYLPSCLVCNNYRWHYLPEELQLILKIGVWAKTEIEKATRLGNAMAVGFADKENRRLKRKTRN